MNNHFPFSKYEAALLLDYFLQYNEAKKTRPEAIKECSSALRKMAINNGLSIDNSYRNEAGIGFQMASMESAFVGTTIVKPATQLFKETVRLYKEQPRQYETLLSEAKSMISDKEDIEKSFFDWFSKKEPFHRDIGHAVETIKQYAIRKRLAEDNIFDVFNCSLMNKIQIALLSDKLFVALHKMQMTQIKVALKNLIEFSAFLEAIQDEQKKEKTTVVDGDVPSEENNKDETNASSGSTNIACTWKDAFVKWLTESQHLSDSTCASLISAVRKAYQYGISQGLSLDGFYSDNVAVAQKKVSELLLYPEFIEFDNGQNHRYSLAVKKYSQYLQRSNANTNTEERKSESINQKRLSSESISSILKISETGKNNVVDQISSISKPDKKESDGIQLKESRYLREDKEAFYCWLRDDQHMAERTCHSYVSNVRSAERIAKEHNLSSIRLFTDDCNEAKATADALFSDAGFVEYNKEQHNRFSAAIGKLFLFYGISHDFREQENDLSDPVNSETNDEDSISKCPSSDVSTNNVEIEVDTRWGTILQDYFPDGYILNDFLCQFQAAGHWQERYGEPCPAQGEDLDNAIKSFGIIRDGRVFAENDSCDKLVLKIVEEISQILTQYSVVYQSCIYNRYREQLAGKGIFTEDVMVQQLVCNSKGCFSSANQVFARQGKTPSVTQDCRKVLSDYGGAMTSSDIAEKLWFIPPQIISRSLSFDNGILSVGLGFWMLAENFPISSENARDVGKMIKECFLAKENIKKSELVPLIQNHLPIIADNLSGLNATAVFNICHYLLNNQFNFSNSIISPKGMEKKNYRDLFIGFAKSHKQFSLEELADYASSLGVPIYWESTFDGGAVRVSEDEFVHYDMVSFQVSSIDSVLERFCPGDYTSIQSIPPAMMIHLPSCGYNWNSYLLLCYVYRFSDTFRLIYNSIGKTGCFGAIVRCSCKDIDSYEKLVERVLTDDDSWNSDDDALSLLVKRGFQARLRMGNLDRIVETARINKRNFGGESFA